MSYVTEGKAYYELLAEELRERIIERGLSYNELSRRSGIDVSSVSRIAKGKCVPTFPVLYALYKAVDSEIKVSEV